MGLAVEINVAFGDSLGVSSKLFISYINLIMSLQFYMTLLSIMKGGFLFPGGFHLRTL